MIHAIARNRVVHVNRRSRLQAEFKCPFSASQVVDSKNIIRGIKPSTVTFAHEQATGQFRTDTGVRSGEVFTQLDRVERSQLIMVELTFSIETQSRRWLQRELAKERGRKEHSTFSLRSVRRYCLQ